ncbi:MAG: hypothetical protein CMB73_02665 [Euryarchaeota archaeon]|nr:hypothetical protein [Euryarchaeota archaeon]
MEERRERVLEYHRSGRVAVGAEDVRVALAAVVGAIVGDGRQRGTLDTKGRERKVEVDCAIV